jgi:hypothetical protein
VPDPEGPDDGNKDLQAELKGLVETLAKEDGEYASLSFEAPYKHQPSSDGWYSSKLSASLTSGKTAT